MKICNYSLIAAAVLATASLAQAQNTNTPNALSPALTNTTPRVHPPAATPGARPSGLMGILSEDQRASYQKINAEMREQLMALQPKIQAAQQEIFEAGLSQKFDENLVRQKAQAAAPLIADTLVIRAKVFSEIQPPLSAEQIEQIKEMANPRPSFTPSVRPVPTTNNNQSGPPAKQ